MAKMKEESNEQVQKTSSKSNKNQDVVIIKDCDVRDQDVLCGKEKRAVSHCGSLKFRVFIDQYAHKYSEATTKQEKMAVTKEIYDTLGSQNARFLKWNTAGKGWEELTSLLARDKISHALRFANREKKTTVSFLKPISKGHRRMGSDTSNTTVTTVATELSMEDFEGLMDDDEPLEWKTESQGENNADNMEPAPYAYKVPSYEYERTPTPPPAYHSYAPYYYPPYGPPPAPYYHHYHHYASYPQPSQHHYAAPPPPAPAQQYHQREEAATPAPPMEFPEKPLPEPPVRESSMDVDLAFLVSEPLMEWDLETDEVFVIQ